MKLTNKLNLQSNKDYLVALIAVAAVVYLLNPTLGVFEFLPDNIPFLGNIDEGAAVFLIIAALKYFGYDIRDIFKKDKPQKEVTQQQLSQQVDDDLKK